MRGGEASAPFPKAEEEEKVDFFEKISISSRASSVTEILFLFSNDLSNVFEKKNSFPPRRASRARSATGCDSPGAFFLVFFFRFSGRERGWIGTRG